MKYYVRLFLFTSFAAFSIYAFYCLAAMLPRKPLYSVLTQKIPIDQDFKINGERELERKDEITKAENRQDLQSNGKEHELALLRKITKSQIDGKTDEKHAGTLTRTPRRNLIILSPPRSGSSFLGKLFDSNSKIMYWFEPLRVVQKNLFHDHLSSDKQILSYKTDCINVIESTFKCDFTVLNNNTIAEYSKDDSRWASSALASRFLCPPALAHLNRSSSCLPLSHAMLKNICNAHNHTVVKILIGRVPNDSIANLQELLVRRESHDVRLLHLVRDPRAIIYSVVQSVKWLNETYLSKDFSLYVGRMCNRTVNNLRFGLSAPPSWLRGRFKVIRYEDLINNAIIISQELYKFARFEWSASVEEWINDHNRPPRDAEQQGPYSLYRNVSEVVDNWKNAPMDLIKVVEDNCGDLMHMLGYERLAYMK